MLKPLTIYSRTTDFDELEGTAKVDRWVSSSEGVSCDHESSSVNW